MNNIIIRAPLNNLGYGVVSLNILKSLSENNISPIYWPLGQPSVEPININMVQEAINRQVDFTPNDNILSIWHEHSLYERIGRGKNIGFPFFELNKFNKKTKCSLQCQDTIFVASEWARKIVLQELPNIDVRVIPIGVNTDEFKPFKINIDKPYRFLACGKIEIRKGYDILHELFNAAFTPDDNVELYIAWDNPFLSPEDTRKWINEYKSTALGDKIHFIPRQNSLVNEYCAADCFILPTRAEAICLPLLEALACDKPVITTNYSGPTQFLNKNNAFLVDIDKLEPAVDGIWFHGDREWAHLGKNQETQFIEYMRHCYKNNIVTNPEGLATAQKLTWKNTTDEILKVFYEI